MSFETVLTIIMSIIAVFCVCASIFGCYKLYILRNSMFMIKRNVYVVGISLIFSIIFQITMFCISILFKIYKNDMILIGGTMIHATVYSLFFALLPPYWNKLYKYKWSYELKQNEWKCIINGKICSNNWWIKHKNTLGNWKFINKYIILILMIFGIIASICKYLFLKNVLQNNILWMLLWLFIAMMISHTPLVGLIYLMNKLKTFKDAYYFVGEIRWHSRTFLAFAVVSVGATIYFAVAAKVFRIDAPSIIVQIGTFGSFLLGCVAFGLVMSSTLIVAHNNVHIYSEHNSQDVSLKEILNNEDLFEKFMEHCISELNVEIMTSYVEFNQFLQYISLNDEVAGSQFVVGL